MDQCHVVSRSPANTSAATVVTLIRNIEQLKNKDKLISQLERDLGHRWAAAQFATLERTQGEGAETPVSGALSLPPGVLPEGRPDPDSISWTPTSTPTPGSVEDERSAGDEGMVCGKFDLPRKLKERNKELAEKCRVYLQRTKDLTVHNRELKDSQDRIVRDNNKLQELLEHSKLRLLQASRQVTELKTERRDVSGQSERLEEMRVEMEEDKKKIAALKQACDDKDRRIELIQHRKKRRRAMGSAEKSMGVRETFYGYDVIDEDSQSVGSDTSSMSHSGHSQLSDDDIWGVLSREETERNYHRLALEQLQLQKSHAMLQEQVGGLQDPQREALTKSQTQQDLFEAHCKIEQLEMVIHQIGEGEEVSMLKEREVILIQNKEFMAKINALTEDNKNLVKELTAAEDKVEDLEFRLMEFEEFTDDDQKPSCPADDESAEASTADQETEQDQLVSGDSQQLGEDQQEVQIVSQQLPVAETPSSMEQLRKELSVLLKGRGKEAESVLRKIDRLKNIEENATAMEEMAHELQRKIVSLQHEKDNLQDELRKAKGNQSKSAQELQENLELKVQIDQLISCQTRLTDERDALLEQVTDLKTQNVHLKRQLDIVTIAPEKIHEPCVSDPESPNQSPNQSPRRRKLKSRGEDDSTPETKRRRNNNSDGVKSVRSFTDVKPVNTEVENIEAERMRRQVRKLESELRGCKDENLSLMSRIRQSIVEKSSAAEADQGLTTRLHELENELDLLRQENETLSQRQRRREEELDSGEISPRTSELEEFCEDLQERLLNAESNERHLREKLKMVEGIVQDSEAMETSLREANDRHMAGEVEAKNQLAESHKFVVELKDMLQDKDIHEQGLRIKVDFLQKAEAASVHRIEELEAVQRDLREQLELAGSGDEAGRLQELRKQMSFLETDNQALSSRVAELEENEETLRENWRRVAEDDRSRTQMLEEKLKMLQESNHNLKSKLNDAQEYFVINTVPQNSNSLASELAQSQTSLRSAAPYSGSDDSDTEEDAETRQLREKVRKLERKITDITDKKDAKIETLQETIVELKETEIKLSETIAEMEMTEREIRAKLALYESSEVTVEKMIKYQSKIQELRTSQESLLDQLEVMESAEMTQQEKYQEMERTLRGSIVTLEVEMKKYKQQEIKSAARIRELEKVEKELSEKVAQQADKENGLYVKISSLMDEIKELRENNNQLKTELDEKDEKVRKSKLLEVKLLEIEMEHGKKSSALSSKLRHKEEELRQKEVSHEEEIKILKDQMSQKTSNLEDCVKTITCERDEFKSKNEEIMEEMKILKESKEGFEKKMEDMIQEVSFMKSVGMESEEKLSEKNEELIKERKRSEELEKKKKEMEDELIKERQIVSELENQIVILKDDISNKMQKSESVVYEKEKEHEKERISLKNELEVKITRVQELEKKVTDLNEHIQVIEAECKQVKLEAQSAEGRLNERLRVLEISMNDKEAAVRELKIAHEKSLQSAKDQCHRMEAEVKLVKAISEEKDTETNDMVNDKNIVISEKEEKISKLESELLKVKQHLDDKNLEVEIVQEELSRKAREHEEEVSNMKSEQEILEKELRNKVLFLNTQLNKETEAREVQQTFLDQQGGREKALTKEVDRYKHDLMEKLTELEVKNKENCKLSLDLSQANHSLKTMQLEFDAARQSHSKTETDQLNQLDEKDRTIDKIKNDFENLQSQFSELESNLCEKEISIEELRSNNSIIEQKLAEKELVVEEKCQKELVVHEQMQQTVQLLQESGREKQNHENHLGQLKKEIEEKTTLLLEKETHIKNQKVIVEKLEVELQETNEKLLYQSEELEEKQSLQKIKDKEIEVLKKRVEEAENEVNLKESENVDNRTLLASKMNSQQQELACAQEELQKCLNDIQQAEKECFIKDQQIEQKDQTNNELLLEKQELKLQLETQRQELSFQLEEQTQSAQTDISSMQHKLKDAENRYRELEAKVASLELQLEERFASAQSAEKILVSNETEMQELKTKLLYAESQYTKTCSDLEELEVNFNDLKNQKELIENKYNESVTALQEKNDMCKNLEIDLIGVNSQCENLKTESSEMQIKSADYKMNLEIAQNKISEIETSLTNTKKECDESNKQILKLENKLFESEETSVKSQRQLEESERQLNEKSLENEELLKKYSEFENVLKDKKKIEEKLQALEKSVEVKEDDSNLELELIELKSNYQDVTNKLTLKDSELADTKRQLDKVTEQFDEASHQLEDANCRLAALTEQHYDQQGQLLAQTAQIEGLEVGVREKGHKCEFLEANLEESCLEKDAALSEIKHLEGAVEKLETENLSLHEELDDASKEIENLRKGFEGRLKTMTDEKQVLEEKLKLINKDNDIETYRQRVLVLDQEIEEKNKSSAEISKENNSLKLRISELETELLKANEISKSDSLTKQENTEDKEDLTDKYAELKNELEVIQKDLSQERTKSKMLKERMKSLLTDNESLTEECINLNHELDNLREKAKSVNSAVDESQINVTLVNNLSTPIKIDSNDNETSTKYDEHNVRIDELIEEINVFKEKDEVAQEKLKSLEICLKELKERESKFSSRVNELEVKEKDLLEHITDIEKTVIVPLEAENDELKEELSNMRDEIVVIKEERDEAIAMLDSEEDSARDFQTLQKSLQESLLSKEELENDLHNSILAKEEVEKNNVGLLDRISSLDKEKGNLMEKISNLETEKSEVQERLSQLENLESQTTVVEEAENRLMDRVLDLEEKEQQLLSDNEDLTKQISLLKTNETALQDKLKYLEKKNEVLKDAEEKYMDKIMELEEIQHRYQAQLALLETVSVDSKPNPLQPEIISESLSQVHVSQVKEIQLKPSKSTISVDTSDLDTSPGDSSIDSSEVPQHAIQILESENERLKKNLDTKQSELDSLQKKFELIQDSEARLMEKLEEVQEKAESEASRSSPKEDQEKKIESLLEENEFLAENIENYKRFFKEEKQKNNDLNDRLLEESSQKQELQAMVSEIQSEYEDQLQQMEEKLKITENSSAPKEESEIRITELIKEKNNLEEERDALRSKVSNLEIEVRSVVSWKNAREAQDQEESKDYELQNKISEINELNMKLSDMEFQISEIHELKQKVTESEEMREKISEMEEKLSQMEELRMKISDLSSQNEKLQCTLDTHNQMEEDIRSQENLRRQELQGKIDALTQRKDELRAREQRLQAEVDAALQRESSAVKALEALESELSEMRQAVARQDRRGPYIEEEHQSDSGLSHDTDRGRNDSLDKGTHQETRGSPIVFSSIATLTLTRPQSTSPVNHRSSPVSHDGRPSSTGPIPPPRIHRKSKSRGSSFDSSYEKDLSPLVDDHREREAALKKRIQELESKNSPDVSQRIAELESANESLKRRVKLAERQSEAKKDRDAHLAGQDEISWGLREEVEEEKEEVSHTQGLNTSFSSVTSNTSSIMLDRPEDVLHQRIKELERLNQHNKNQMSELESDREVLHEIARKDKNSIHDLNIKVRELQLSERSLKEQVNSLESSESSLFSKCEEMEASKSSLEDRVHELEIHERRLRELVRKLKLDEEHWLSKSGGMENAVAELSANEQQLKRLLQDVELERGGMAERTEYMEARVQELEAVEVSLLQRIKNYENNEVTLQNRLVHLENAEQAAQSKASELEVINMDVSQRLQRAVEENSVMSQHNTQLHGQVQDLDRRLMTSRDAELAYKQHVEALQKNESSLQKKVREYELREIDSQARIRELEQTMEITQDKLATLQRSENKLKYRVQELEGIGGQIPGELTPSQRQKVPQKLEDCQKRVMVLQAQVESLQVQLRHALSITQGDSQSQNVQEDENAMTVSKDDYNQLQTKLLLLDETTCQLEEVEKLNEGLNAVILELRQGKGASGHEVEIEVLKRRLSSYKTLMQRLKSSLSKGQATSLLDSDSDSGPEGDSLPGPILPGSASERVLQSVCGNNDKADSLNQGHAPSPGLAHSDDTPIQASHAVLNLAPVEPDSSSQSGQPSSREESHWRAIEARRPPGGEGSRGGTHPAPGVTITKSQSCGVRRDGLEEEEVTLGLNLPSESESRFTHNDTDSSVSGPVPPPRRLRAARAAVNPSSGSESNDGRLRKAAELSKTTAATNKKHFALKEKSLPSSVGNAALGGDQWALKKQSASLMSFGEDSFYLPSSVQEEGGSTVSESDEAPPLPYTRPPGGLTSSPREWSDNLSDGMTSDLQGKPESLNNSSTSGMSIRDRIAMIEKQLTDTGEHSDNEVFYWKKKSSEAARQAEGLEKENKHLKEDINKLEKELEEKRRYINLLELWLSSVETTYRNKDKQTDRELLEQIQMNLSKLRKELSQVGYRSEDAVLDPAALKTELERKDREVMSKKSEVEALNLELKRTRAECESIEGMRRSALDSLRGLERELVGLEDAEAKSKIMEKKLKKLQDQYDEMENYKNQAVNMIQPLQVQIDRLTRKCKEKDTLLRRLGGELRRVCHRPSSVLDDLTRLEHLMEAEENKNSKKHGGQGVSGTNSVEEMDLGLPLSDTDSIGGDSSAGRRKRAAPYVNNRPRSAEGQGSQRGTHAHSRWVPRTHHQIAAGISRGQFVAVADYDPSMFSQSGRPELELAMREGDHVVVTGSLDSTGYYEAVVSGRSGLVPSSYLQPLNGHHHCPETHIDHSPEQTVDLYRRLNQAPSPSGQPVKQPRKSFVEKLPEPPRQLHVEAIVNEKSILLSWLPPALDERGCSNGHKVLGYMVYLDGAEFEQVSGHGQCQVVLEEVSSDRPHRLSVQCLCGRGFTSPRAELVFEGLVKLDNNQPELNTDLSSVLNSVHYKRGHKRMVMGIYDYSPEHQSPHDYTAFELAFSAGDVIHVYGDPRQDGFFHGEMGGKRGLVPACFVQDVTPEKLKSSNKSNS